MHSLNQELQDRICSNIRAYMAANALTPQDVADRMGIQRQSVNNYLSQKNLSERSIKKFSEALDYPYQLLVNGIPYTGEDKIAELERRLHRLEELLNIKSE